MCLNFVLLAWNFVIITQQYGVQYSFNCRCEIKGMTYMKHAHTHTHCS